MHKAQPETGLPQTTNRMLATTQMSPTQLLEILASKKFTTATSCRGQSGHFIKLESFVLQITGENGFLKISELPDADAIKYDFPIKHSLEEAQATLEERIQAIKEEDSEDPYDRDNFLKDFKKDLKSVTTLIQLITKLARNKP